VSDRKIEQLKNTHKLTPIKLTEEGKPILKAGDYVEVVSGDAYLGYKAVIDSMTDTHVKLPMLILGTKQLITVAVTNLKKIV
jgi:transcription antitermination factor NusG